MSKTLIFPDLHQPPLAHLDLIESTIKAEAPQRIVFLGDYFDQWHDGPEDARRTAKWLQLSLCDPRRAHLIGNHDASYIWAGAATYCPGFTIEKLNEINSCLDQSAKDQFKFYTWVDGWLLTHAGLSADWVPAEAEGDALDAFLTTESDHARRRFDADEDHWFCASGRLRGGPNRAGGILWCDEREHIPIPGQRQLFGHTPGRSVRGCDTNNVCLDTNLQHYAIIQDGGLTTKHFLPPEPPLRALFEQITRDL